MHLNFLLLMSCLQPGPSRGGSQQADWPRVGEEETVFWEVRLVRTANASICIGHHFAYQRVGRADQDLQLLQSMEKDTLLLSEAGAWEVAALAGKISGTREVRNKKSGVDCKEEGSENEKKRIGPKCMAWMKPLDLRDSEAEWSLSPFPFSLLVLYMYACMNV